MVEWWTGGVVQAAGLLGGLGRPGRSLHGGRGGVVKSRRVRQNAGFGAGGALGR
jgi:hypothetical protein